MSAIYLVDQIENEHGVFPLAYVLAARVPWYRVIDGRFEFRTSNESEFRRLFDACVKSDVKLWLACKTAQLIAERRGCELAEAWDRLAHALECYAAEWRPLPEGADDIRICEGCGLEVDHVNVTSDDVELCDGCWEATPMEVQRKESPLRLVKRSTT